MTFTRMLCRSLENELCKSVFACSVETEVIRPQTTTFLQTYPNEYKSFSLFFFKDTL